MESVPKSVPVRQPKGTELALRALQEAIAESGVSEGNTVVPGGTRAVTGKTWHAKYNMLDKPDVASGDPNVLRRESEARKQRLKRARQALVSGGTVRLAGDWYWIP